MILYITRKFPPSIGGMQRFNEKLVKNLRKQTEIHLIAWGGSQLFLPFFLVYAFIGALIVCSFRKIKVIYVSDALLSPLGLALKALTRKSVVANVHGTDIVWPFSLYQLIVPWSLRRLDRVICVSHALKTECIKRAVPERKTCIIPNGVDIGDFSAKDKTEYVAEIENLIGQSIRGRKILLSVGRLIIKKGIDSFLLNIFPRILEHNNDIIYLIAGDGPHKRKITRIIQEHKLENHAFLIGNLPMNGSLLKGIYHCADIFVMPNTGIEGFGIVILEANAAGLPIVASKIGGIGEIIKEGETGYLIDPTHHLDFAQKVNELLLKPDLCLQMGRKGQEHVREHYSWETIVQSYLKEFYLEKPCKKN